MKLAELELQELLGSLEGDQDALPVPPPTWIDKWLEHDGIYPGTTRVRSKDLYAQYERYMAQHGGDTKKMAFRVWGKEITRRFKKTRYAEGWKYWISREETPKIPASLKKPVKSRK